MFTYIDSIQDLDFLNKELLQKTFLGVDTEFRRTSKNNMKLGLLQVNDDEEIYLIDTILIEEPKEQCSFLFSDSVTKIFHSCKEDIEAIYSWSGRVLVNLFDTQLAEAFLGGNYSIGYQPLVEQRLDIILDKNETRSNWIRRPLTDSQLKYAAADVEFLVYLFLEQRELLKDTKKLEWHNEEIRLLIPKVLCSSNNNETIISKLDKSEENQLLNKFHEIVINISDNEGINPTLFFSKKNQRDFIRICFNKGLHEASLNLSKWRRDLILDPLKNILEGY